MLDSIRLLATLAAAALLAGRADGSTLTDVVRAPELPISAPRLAAAAGDQVSPLMATNGDLSLAVWHDARQGGGVIYATRLDRDGHPLDPLGLVLDVGLAAEGVVWNGAAFTVVFQSFSGLSELVNVGTDGRVSSPKPLGVPSSDQFAGISGGGGSAPIVVLQPPMALLPLSFSVLDANGNRVAPFPPPNPADLFAQPDL